VQRLKFFLLNSERCLWYDGRCCLFENFESARHFRIESNRIGIVRFEFESNLEASQVPSLYSILIISIIVHINQNVTTQTQITSIFWNFFSINRDVTLPSVYVTESWNNHRSLLVKKITGTRVVTNYLNLHSDGVMWRCRFTADTVCMCCCQCWHCVMCRMSSMIDNVSTSAAVLW